MSVSRSSLHSPYRGNGAGLAFGRKNTILRRGARTGKPGDGLENGEFCGGTAFFCAGAEHWTTPN